MMLRANRCSSRIRRYAFTKRDDTKESGLFQTMTVLAAAVALAAPAVAANDPASVVGDFNSVLIAAMQAGKGTSLGARTAKLLPLVKATHDLPGMTRLVAGPAWATTSAADQKALTEAFSRHSALTYATNFASFDGEKFVVEPKVDIRGSDALVHVKLVAKDATTPLGYRLHQADGGWRIIDVFADGVSQIAVQRSEFASTVKAGGAAALTAKLNAADEAKLRR